MKILAQFIWSKLGNCSLCTQAALRLALMAILATIASRFLLPRPATLFIACCAIGLLTLWMAHVVVFSLKALARRNKSSRTESPMISRRKLFTTFANVAAVTALSSALPKLAIAQQSCSDGRTCPASAPYFCYCMNGGPMCSPQPGGCHPPPRKDGRRWDRQEKGASNPASKPKPATAAK